MVPCGAIIGDGCCHARSPLLLSFTFLISSLADIVVTGIEFRDGTASLLPPKPLLSMWEPIWVRSANFRSDNYNE